MMEIAHIWRVIATVEIRIKNAARCYLSRYQRHQGYGLGVVHHLGKYLTPTFQDTKYNHLASSAATSLTLAHTTKIALIQLYCAIKYFMRLKLYMMTDHLPNLLVKQHGCIRLNVQYICR